MRATRLSQSSLFGSFSRYLFTLLLAIGAVYGQGTSGAIDVTVTDASGSVVPGAVITALNTGTGAQFRSVANEAGRAHFLLLPRSSRPLP